MAEFFEYSKAKYEREVLAPARRNERLQLAVAVAIVAGLAAAYVSQYVLHWW